VHGGDESGGNALENGSVCHVKNFLYITYFYSRREPNSHGFERQISAPATEKILAISYIASHFLFASAKYLLAQNCAAPSGVVFFDGFCQSEAKQDTHLARRDLAKDAKNTRRRAYEFGSLRLYCTAFSRFL
jgi:hypothetical protein